MPEPVTDLSERRLLSAALAFSERGWFVFPVYEALADGLCGCHVLGCNSPGKHPRTRRGWKDATTDESLIREWWKNWPHSNIGVATGPSCLAIVDVDPRNEGDQALAELETEKGKLPATLTALTGGGGQHLIYARPTGLAVLKSRVLARGVEFKADGGYVVAPPSSHVSGRPYTWDVGQPGEPAELPEWILEKLKSSKTARPHSGLPPEKGLLGAAFVAAGWSRGHAGHGQLIVRCPWESAHTTGRAYDSSTVVFPPTQGSRWGHFHCSHSHCEGRTYRDVLDALPQAAVAAARKQVQVDELAPILDADPEPAVITIESELKNPEWAQSLTFNASGQLKNHPGNLSLLLGNHEDWRGTLRLNRMLNVVEWAKRPPPVAGMPVPSVGARLADHDYLYVLHWFTKNRNVLFARESVRDAVDSAAAFSPYDPLELYLDSLIWDGESRVDRWLETYLGAEDSSYSRFVGAAWLLSAIARAYQPGCQVDYTLVLEGPQGCGKTTALRILGGAWYLGDLPDIRDNNAILALVGRWIVELSELDAIRGVDLARVKRFLSELIDHYRKPYGRNMITHARRCVFAGTTNEKRYLKDSTGARRFWPVKVTQLDRDALIKDRDQLFAEAAVRYRALETWHPTLDHGEMLSEQQSERYDADPWEETLGRYLSGKEWPDVANEFILGSLLNIEPGKRTRKDAQRVRSVMMRLHYEHKQASAAGGIMTWMWKRARAAQESPDPEEP